MLDRSGSEEMARLLHVEFTIEGPSLHNRPSGSYIGGLPKGLQGQEGNKGRGLCSLLKGLVSNLNKHGMTPGLRSPIVSCYITSNQVTEVSHPSEWSEYLPSHLCHSVVSEPKVPDLPTSVMHRDLDHDTTRPDIFVTHPLDLPLF